MAKRSSQKLVNDWVDKCIHPITGFVYKDKYEKQATRQRSRKVVRTKNQLLIIKKAKSISMKRLYNTATEEEIKWLANYKRNKEEFLNDNK